MKRLIVLSLIFLLSILVSSRLEAQLPVPRLDSVFPLGSKAGGSVEVVLKGAELDPSGKLFFDDSRITSTPLGNSRYKVSVEEGVPPGIYDLRHGGRNGTTSSVSFLVSNLEGLVSSKEVISIDNAMIVDATMVVDGLMDKGNAHFYKFSARKGERVFIDCFAERINSRMDALIVAKGPLGNEVARSREAVGGDPLIDFRASQDGEYILRVSDFLTRGGDDYWYRVKIRKGAQIDFFLPSTARPGVDQKFQIYGRNLPGGVPSGEDDLEMIEMNIDVPELMERQRSGPTKPVNAGIKGFHYSIGLGQNSPLSNSIFIPFSDNPTTIENGVNVTSQDSQLIDVPSEVSGRFYPGKKSWFSFEAKKDDEYVIEIISNRIHGPSDPVIAVDKIIKEPSGKENVSSLGKADDQDSNIGGRRYPTNHRDPSFKFKADSNFTARITLKDNFSTKLPYRLIVRKPKPDFELIVSVSVPDGDNNKGKKIIKGGIAVRGGQVGKLDVYALRKDGFNEAIEIRIKGLPDNFEVSPVYIGKGKNYCALNFYNKENSPNWVGDVEVVGTSMISGESVTKTAESVSVNWSVNDADKERVVSRTSSLLTISSVSEKIPLSVLPAEDKIWESALGATLEIPVRFESTAEIKDKVTVLPIDFPGMGKAPQIQVDKGKTKESHKLVIPLLNNKDNNKYNEGEHQFIIKASTKLGYRRDLHVLNEAEARSKKSKEDLDVSRKSIEGLKKSIETAKQKLEEVKKMTETSEEDKKEAMKEAASFLKMAEIDLDSANSKLKELEEVNKKIEEEVKKASEKAKPKDIQFVAYSKPVRVKINSTPTRVMALPVKAQHKGGKGNISVSIERLFGFAGEVNFAAVFPEKVKGINVESVSSTKDQTKVEIPFEVTSDATVGPVNFDLSCKIKFNGVDLVNKVPVLFEILDEKQERVEDKDGQNQLNSSNEGVQKE